jgi:hypothetical protein
MQVFLCLPMALCIIFLSISFFIHEADFIQELLKKNHKKLARSFNFTFRYMVYVLSLNNVKFGKFVDHIYLTELEIKEIPRYS